MIKNLIYVSNPVGFNEKNIKNILETSNINNKKNKVTGCLIYRQDLYLQFLEGPQKELEFTYNKILSDKRHTDIHKLSENSTKRLILVWMSGWQSSATKNCIQKAVNGLAWQARQSIAEPQGDWHDKTRKHICLVPIQVQCI